MKNCKETIIKRILLSIVIIAVSSILLIFSYTLGRDKGRDETVKMIDDIAQEYEFLIKQGDWQLATGTNGNFYPGSSDSVRIDYDIDDQKIHLTNVIH